MGSSHGFWTLERCTGGFQPNDKVPEEGKRTLETGLGRWLSQSENLSSTPSWLWQSVLGNLVLGRQRQRNPGVCWLARPAKLASSSFCETVSKLNESNC